MRIETFEELLTPRGQELLAEVAARAGVESDLALGSRLRDSYEPDLVAAAVTQNHLRGRAVRKLGSDAARMYFVPEALQQATRREVADHRAHRLTRHGPGSLVDLGCGIGSDLVAFARAGLAVRGVDLDPVRARVARANLDALGLPGSAETGDATAIDTGGYTYAFVDPARRTGHGRTFDPRAFAPDWDFVVGLLEGAAVAKTMPGIAHDLVPDGVEAEWVSSDGALVEATLWGRPLALTARRATVLGRAGEPAVLTDADDPGPGDVSAPGRFLYEPDDAVIRAGLVTAVAARVYGRLIDPHLAYVTSDAFVPTSLATAFEVLEELPYREKQLRAALRARDVGTLTIKKRGVQAVPEELVRRLRLRGDREATVVLTRVSGSGRAYLVRRCTSAPTGVG